MGLTHCIQIKKKLGYKRITMQEKRIEKCAEVTCRPTGFIAGFSNSFVSAGHIRDYLGIRGPVHLLFD
jgi:hypothetical protein